MSASHEQVEAGQAVYTKRTLSVYDFVVLKVWNRFIWKCPTQRLLEHYNKHITGNHLDVGVGTGYFLDRCLFPSLQPRVALMDLNSDSLKFASQRISRYRPATYRRNILKPISLDGEKFESIGINYLLHCLPGSIESKSVAFDHLLTLMNPNGVLFGSTILHDGVRRNWFARQLMDVHNKKGIFSNQGDDLQGLVKALKKRYGDVVVKVEGCVALFACRA